MSDDSAYLRFASINVNDKTEKKSNLTYLSWAWAVDQLMRVDPHATWSYDEPKVYGGGTMMVFCTVTASGKSMTAQLPVMDHRNKPIPDPDAFQINTAMQRCLAKAIALHGLGLYIYAGEDLPYEEPTPKVEPKLTAEQIQAAKEKLSACKTVEKLRSVFAALPEIERNVTKEFAQALSKSLPEGEKAEA